MSESISEARTRQQEISQSLKRQREQRENGPLDDIRDFRTEPGDTHEPKHEDADARPARRRHVPARRHR